MGGVWGWSMRIAFRASEGGFEADEYALICGLAGADSDGAEHYLNFQRSSEGEPEEEDWGVHVGARQKGHSDLQSWSGKPR